MQPLASLAMLTSSTLDYKMGTNLFTPQTDVTVRLPDGRHLLVCPAGLPMLMAQAIALGAVKEEMPRPAPDERKEAIPVQDVDATAGARKLADSRGISLNNIFGSGADGRILKRDVDAVI